MKKTYKIILLAVAAALFLAVVSHNLLIQTNSAYNALFDKPVFSRLTKTDMDRIERIEIWEDGKTWIYTGEINFFRSMTYDGTKWDNPFFEKTVYHLRVIMQDSVEEIYLASQGDDRFAVSCEGRWFYVRAEEMLGIIDN
ncbi:MAG: hypothetical protein FWE80_01445 [Oscillospiraceae bacterium]|nr:hypothetical protein [Oscillospiraceae bacterium]